MSKPISNAQYRRNVISMPADKQIESISRMLRVIPHWLLEEVARPKPNEIVIKHLESRLRQARLMLSEYYVNGKVA